MENQEKRPAAAFTLLALTVIFLLAAAAIAFQNGVGREQDTYVITSTRADEEVTRAPAKINLNTATADELTALPGIGATLAERIVAYREENGPFRTEEELTRVSGIGEAKLAAMEGLITVEEE